MIAEAAIVAGGLATAGLLLLYAARTSPPGRGTLWCLRCHGRLSGHRWALCADCDDGGLR